MLMLLALCCCFLS